VPVVYLDDGSRFMVVASNSGLDSPPAWYLNLRAHTEAQIRTRAGIEHVVAHELTALESEKAWPRLLKHNPMWGAYQSCTERPSAVVSLERIQNQVRARSQSQMPPPVPEAGSISRR
jgi:deazaflavin-dependent oxidoreductase (nitroreductase family)